MQLKDVYNEQETEAIFYMLLDFFYRIKRIDLSLNKNIEIEEKKMEDALVELKKYKPWQYITEEIVFYGLKLRVNKNVLIPRPETEELVDFIINNHKNNASLKILDIGTGSGAIAISLAKKIINSSVFALDFSEEAIKIAGRNALENNVKVNFIKHDILQDFDCKEKFDIIVSNPPYIQESEKKTMRKNVLNYEPYSALFVPENNPLIFYDKIIDFYKKYSRVEGKLYFETNEFLKNELIILLKQKNINNYIFKKDIFDKWRILKISH